MFTADIFTKFTQNPTSMASPSRPTVFSLETPQRDERGIQPKSALVSDLIRRFYIKLVKVAKHIQKDFLLLTGRCPRKMLTAVNLRV